MRNNINESILFTKEQLEQKRNKILQLTKKEISKEKNLFLFENYKLISDCIISAANSNFN
jgi:hypothetical protein